MRIPALAILTTVTVLTAAPTLAQTYSPDYPVCLQAYRWGGSDIECGYTLAGAVRHVSIGPRRRMPHQSIFCERASAPGTTLSAASSRLLNIILRRLVRCHLSGMDQFHRTIP